MGINAEDFEGGFRSLCAAFGAQYSEQRMLVYHDTLSPKMTGGMQQWTRIVKGMMMGMSNMPKLVEILSLSDFREGMTKQPTLQSWVSDICRVRDCYDGFISREVNGFDTLFACPLCERHKTNVFPLTAIPTAKRWMGKYETYSDDEMKNRRKQRQEVVDAIRSSASRDFDWGKKVEAIGAMDEDPF